MKMFTNKVKKISWVWLHKSLRNVARHIKLVIRRRPLDSSYNSK